MNLRTTGGLVLLLAGLVGFAYFYEIRGADERDKIRREAGRLLRLEANSVVGLSVHRGDTTIVIAKSEGRWRILKPVATGGDDGEINGFDPDVTEYGPGTCGGRQRPYCARTGPSCGIRP